ncbi:hypothetical protein BVRB_8g200090 [Beta vulgaris subsp. vulgaris]|uniref:Uncharacterized protein n=1 Tax=Beta vulgaris subsp. vulgaris TaxID=3555 RepID=A0A7G2RLY3_BETVV|nr:hypothetical protein BVRB_8g200090 [Beta vulgaris subsp. vulgaris]
MGFEGEDQLHSITTSSVKLKLPRKYIHPDNMFAEGNLNLELKRIRDEFKMHESDCGSTRAQRRKEYLGFRRAKDDDCRLSRKHLSTGLMDIYRSKSA